MFRVKWWSLHTRANSFRWRLDGTLRWSRAGVDAMACVKNLLAVIRNIVFQLLGYYYYFFVMCIIDGSSSDRREYRT